MKNATIYIIMSLLIIGLATAETNTYRLTNVNEKAAQGTQATFSFITGLSGQPRVGQIYMYTTAGFVPSTMGGSCSINQYIVAYQCQTSTGSTCQRMFTDDWQKESSTDLLPYSNWQNEAWFKDVINQYGYKYAAYECLAAKNNPINEKPLYTSSTGQFLTVTLPTTGKTDGKSIIKGQYKVTSEGWFILETGIDPGSRGTTFNIAVSSSQSSCDGSGYYAGTRIYGKPGDIYEFTFTIKNPSNEGTYTITVHAWTDCYKNGGKYITGTTGRITLTKSSTTTNCGSTDTDGDGIKDGCDACPKDYGVADIQGCHPCYGYSDVTTTEAKKCYYTNQDKYGIPIIVLDIIDPYITAIQECRNNALATVKIRQSGLRSTIGTPTTCTAGTTCTTESTTSASCKTPTTSVPTVVKTDRICSGNDITATQTLSDGSTRDLGTVTTCEPSESQCQDGTCQPLICGDCTGPIVITDPECSASSDCPNGQWCDGTKKCAPISLSTCTSNADCKDPARPVCNLQIGACLAEKASECSDTKLCTASTDKCLAGFCVPKETVIINDTTNTPIPCTADQELICGDGSTIRSALCVNGELEPIGVNCENAGGNDNTITEKIRNILTGISGPTIPGIPATITIPGTNSTFNPVLAIGIVLIIVIVFIVLKKTGPKKKKGKR